MAAASNQASPHGPRANLTCSWICLEMTQEMVKNENDSCPMFVHNIKILLGEFLVKVERTNLRQACRQRWSLNQIRHPFIFKAGNLQPLILMIEKVHNSKAVKAKRFQLRCYLRQERSIWYPCASSRYHKIACVYRTLFKNFRTPSIRLEIYSTRIRIPQFVPFGFSDLSARPTSVSAACGPPVLVPIACDHPIARSFCFQFPSL